MRLALHCLNAAKQYAEQQLALATDEFSISLLLADEAESQDILAADALILFCPENFAAVAGGMKSLFDRCFYPWLAAIESTQSSVTMAKPQAAKPYQIVIDSGNDGSFCLQQLERILTGVSAKAVQPAVILHAEPTAADIAAMHELGQGFVEALHQGMF